MLQSNSTTVIVVGAWDGIGAAMSMHLINCYAVVTCEGCLPPFLDDWNVARAVTGAAFVRSGVELNEETEAVTVTASLLASDLPLTGLARPEGRLPGVPRAEGGHRAAISFTSILGLLDDE